MATSMTVATPAKLEKKPIKFSNLLRMCLTCSAGVES